jgi:ribosome-associated protein
VDKAASEGKIPITSSLSIDERELQWEFVRAQGPGGQKVNKTATAVQLRFDVINSPSLPTDIRERLMHLAAGKINRDGVLIIEARRYRTQKRNREDAQARLVELLRKATRKPKPRHKTTPPPEAEERRLKDKRLRGEKKRMRGSVPSDDV